MEMKENNIPNADPEMERLTDLLGKITPPEKSGNEWLVMENRLMADLARIPAVKEPIWRRIPDALAGLFSTMPRPALAAGLAVLALAVCLPLFTRHTKQSLTPEVLTMQGDVFIAGQKYRVPGQGAVTVAMESETGWRLLENSELTVLEADTRFTSLFLEKGTVLCKVKKREKGQRFIVTTPNAICEVVGTRFKVEVTLIAGVPYTLLTVIEGKVALASLDDPKSRRIIPAQAVAGVHGRTMEHTAPLQDVAAAEEEMSRLIFEREAALNRAAPQSGTAPTGSGPGHSEQQKVEILKLLKTVSSPAPELETKAPPAGADPESGPLPDMPVPASSPLQSTEYQTGLEKLQDNRYLRALELFEGMTAQSNVYNKDERIQVLDKIARCYRGLGNYASCAATLEQIYDLTENGVKKDNLLWEIASIKAFFLNDYARAEADLLAYTVKFPEGLWIQEAYIKLAEIRYLLKKPEEAVATYEAFLKNFHESSAADKAMYNLAYILGHDLDDCAKAVEWYTSLMEAHPRSLYQEDARFWRADCMARLGRKEAAIREFKAYLAGYPQGRWKGATLERLESISISRR